MARPGAPVRDAQVPWDPSPQAPLRGAFGAADLILGLTQPNGMIPGLNPETDIGPRRSRGPQVVATLTGTIASTKTVPVPNSGWLEFIPSGSTNNFTGYSYLDPEGSTATAYAVPINPMDMVPCPPNGQAVFTGAAATGQATIVWWSYDAGMMRAAARTNFGVFLRGPGGGVISPTQNVTDGLTTALAAGVQLPSSATGVHLRMNTDPANAAAVFIADTQAKAALLGALGGGVPISASGEYEYTGTSWVASAAGTMKAYSTRDT